MRRVLYRFACAAFLLIAIAALETASAAIDFDDFSSVQGLKLVGDAKISGKAVRLTPARHDRSGAVWFDEKQPVESGFETTFQFQLTGEGGMGRGADGFAFVLQNSGPEALGGRGSAGGFAVADQNYKNRQGIPWSIAVFFDTFRNREEGDPSANYIALRTYGRPADMRWPAARLAFTPKLHVHLKDRKPHTARIVFRPPVLSVYLDGSKAPVLETAVDLSIVADAQGRAWAGFTASTGGGYENHDILNWSFSGTAVSSNMAVVTSEITFLMSACLPDRNLCTPEHAIVERKGSGYHVVLPANLEWGASIPNPSGRPVDVTGAHGVACWDLKAQGSNGCGGPSGNGTNAGAEFLALDSAAGSLIMRTRDGRTSFSVNGRENSFGGNEGFYEFDAEVK